MDNAQHELARFYVKIATLRRRIATLEVSEANYRTVIDEFQYALEELRVAEEELRRQNEELAYARHQIEAAHQRYQDLFNWAPDGYLVTDAHGTIEEANQFAGTLFAIAPPDLIGKPLATFVAPEHRRPFRRQLARLPHMEHGREWETVLQPRHGPAFHTAITATAIRDAGQVTGFRWLLRDITERKRGEQTLRRSQHQFRRLAGHLHQMQEQERARIAREIHDEVAQAFTGMYLDITWLLERLTTVPEASEHLRAMAVQLDELDKAVHRIATELRPSLLDDLGLLAAVEWQLQEVCQRTGLSYTLLTPQEEPPLDPELATAVFRILQEALTNVVRHAKASEVVVRVMLYPEAILLEVIDDGRGITLEQRDSPDALGLLGMRERAQLWEGEVTIQGTPDLGTTVTVQIPFCPSNPEQVA